jgi:Predicted membrane protein
VAGQREWGRSGAAAGRADAAPFEDSPREPEVLLRTARGEVDEVRESIDRRWDEVSEPIRGRLRAPVAKVSGWARRVQALRTYRSYRQYAYAEGNLRAAGMSFQALFALFAAVWAGFSVIGLVVGGNDAVIDALASLIDSAVPGLIAYSGQAGVISLDAFGTGSGFGWTGVIASAGLLWTAIAWLYYTRQAVRAMFGLGPDPRNYVLQKVTDFVLAVAFGLVLVISAALSVASTEALTLLFGLFGIPDDSFWFNTTVRVTGLVLVVALNMLTLGTMYRVLSRVAIPWRRLVSGALVGAIALGVLSTLSGAIVAGAGKNPLFASFAVIIGLLLYLNIVSRVMLLGASWIAIGMKDHGISPLRLTSRQREYELADEVLRARVVVARSDLADAEEALADASWLGRFTARRALSRARTRLAGLEAEQGASTDAARVGRGGAVS